MRSSACPRLSDAEAKRDQRLGPAELASFERHLDTCDACAREVENLEALAAPLRDGAPHGVEVDELHARRERTRLLLAFDQMAEAPVRARTRTRAAVRWRAWQFAAAAAAVVLAAAERCQQRESTHDGSATAAEQLRGDPDQPRAAGRAAVVPPGALGRLENRRLHEVVDVFGVACRDSQEAPDRLAVAIVELAERAAFPVRDAIHQRRVRARLLAPRRDRPLLAGSAHRVPTVAPSTRPAAHSGSRGLRGASSARAGPTCASTPTNARNTECMAKR